MANAEERDSGRMAVVNWVESFQLTLSKPWGKVFVSSFGKSLGNLEVLSSLLFLALSSSCSFWD